MDQQKIKRLLGMLLLLSGKRRYSIAEIQERFDISDRTVFRYLETFEIAGLMMDRAGKGYRLQQDSSIWPLVPALRRGNGAIWQLRYE